jgi:uncharacterized integral membrane protein
MRWLRRGLLFTLLAAVMLAGWRFAAENQEPVRLHYVAGELGERPLWMVTLAAFAAGAALGGLFAAFASAKNGLTSRRYRKAIGGLEAEVHQLRNLPLAPEPDARGAPGRAPPSEGAFGRDG